MKIGAYVPLFDGDVEHIGNAARRIEAAGLDGVFVFDGVRKSGRPAFPVLEAMDLVLEATREIPGGPLVVRAGDDRAGDVHRCLSRAHDRFGERLVAGLGVGDSSSFELEGRQVANFETRVGEMADTALALRDRGAEVWLGGRSEAITLLARSSGLSQNLWEPEVGEVATMVAEGRSVSWAGRCEMDAAEMLATMKAWRREQAEWCVFLVKGSGKHPERAFEALERAVAEYRNDAS